MKRQVPSPRGQRLPAIQTASVPIGSFRTISGCGQLKSLSAVSILAVAMASVAIAQTPSAPPPPTYAPPQQAPAPPTPPADQGASTRNPRIDPQADLNACTARVKANNPRLSAAVLSKGLQSVLAAGLSSSTEACGCAGSQFNRSKREGPYIWEMCALPRAVVGAERERSVSRSSC